MQIHYSKLIPELLFVALGVIAAFYLIRAKYLNYYYSRTCKRWPKVKGKIIETPIAYSVESNMIQYNSYRTVHNVNIKYEYKVEEILYLGNRISFGSETLEQSTVANRIAEMFEKDEIIDVYYHPQRHHISVLKP